MSDDTTRKPRRVIKFCVLGIVLIVVGVIVWLFVLPYNPGAGPPSFTISKATTHITQPLDARGRPDYVAWLNAKYGEGVTKENNAFVGYVVLLPNSSFGAGMQRRLFDTLGIEPDPSRPRLPEIDEEALDEFESLAERGWVDGQTNRLAAAIDDHSAALDALVAASERPRYFEPIIANPESPRLLESLAIGFRTFRHAADLLVARAHRAAASGDIAAARSDLNAAARIGHHLAQGESLIDYLAGLVIERDVLDAYRQFATSGKLSAEAYRKLIDDVAALRPQRPMWEALDDGGRLTMIDAIVGLSDDPAAMGDEFSLGNAWGEILHRMVDWDVVLTDAHAVYDEPIAAMKIADVQKRHAEVMAIARNLDARFSQPASGGATGRVSLLVQAIFAPSFVFALSVADRQPVERALTLTALRLAEHRARVSSYPAALAEIEAYKTAGPPIDLFSGKPLVYERTHDGYLLYSVGEDFKDDGAQSETTKNWRGVEVTEELDIVIRVGGDGE